MMIDWHYPFLFGVDLKSRYKSLWLGWFLVTWTYNDNELGNLRVDFQPGL